MDRGQTVRQVFRCIARHARFLNDERIYNGTLLVKEKIRKSSAVKSAAQWQHRMTRLLKFERLLVDIEDGKLLKSQFELAAGIKEHLYTIKEANQKNKMSIWIQQKERRFDLYNRPAQKDTADYRRVDRLARFSSTVNQFAKRFGVSPDSLVVKTVLAPYWKESRRREKPIRPVRVALSSFRRQAGRMYVLQLHGGGKLPGRGLRRHVEAIKRDSFSSLKELEFQLWLAQQYTWDPLDGEDMTQWIDALRQEIARQKKRYYEYQCAVEVHRRILMRRREELQRDWDWRFRRKVQSDARQRVLNPKPLLTLDAL